MAEISMIFTTCKNISVLLARLRSSFGSAVVTTESPAQIRFATLDRGQPTHTRHEAACAIVLHIALEGGLSPLV